MKEPKIRKIVTNLEEVFYEGGAEKPASPSRLCPWLPLSRIRTPASGSKTCLS